MNSNIQSPPDGAGWSASQKAPWTRTERFGLAVAMAGAAGFLVLTLLISIPRITQLDEWVIRSLRTTADPLQPIGPAWFVELARDFTALGGYGVLCTLTVLITVFLILESRPRRAGFVITVVISAYVIGMLLKNMVGRPRPEIVPYLSFAHSESFPSGHSMMSAALYLSLGMMLSDLAHRRRIKVFLVTAPLVVSACVGASRVYMGVHYPTDVAAGWLAGMSWALLCWVIARRQKAIHRIMDQETHGDV